jgi:hypothetical protein
MNRATLVRFAVLMLLALTARAQNALEIITLRHRTAEQVLPSLQPLLEPGGTLSGQGAQLFVRTSPANLDDLRLALTALDEQRQTPRGALVSYIDMTQGKRAVIGFMRAQASAPAGAGADANAPATNEAAQPASGGAAAAQPETKRTAPHAQRARAEKHGAAHPREAAHNPNRAGE